MNDKKTNYHPLREKHASTREKHASTKEKEKNAKSEKCSENEEEEKKFGLGSLALDLFVGEVCILHPFPSPPLSSFNGQIASSPRSSVRMRIASP